MTTTAAEFKTLLGQFNRGISSVEIDHGILCVYSKSRKCTTGVVVDLLRSRAFSSVKAGVDGSGKEYVVHAVPA